MSSSIKKLWNDYGIVGILIILAIAYALFNVYSTISNKGKSGAESMTQTRNKAYNNGGNSAPRGAQESGNEVYSSVTDNQTSGQGLPSSCNKANTQNPADLLPKDNNSQWAQLNPAGKGDLANINLLKAGYHIGIDTIGQTLRNGNLQIRSEPANPQVDVGPWNLSTIEPDFMRPPLELGQGGQ